MAANYSPGDNLETESRPLPRLVASSDDSDDDEKVTFGSFAQSHTFRSPPIDPSMPGLTDSDNNSETEADSDNSSYDSDTWGGTFSLSHTRRQAEQNEAVEVDQTSIISRLTPRTLFALTDYIGIPHSLRPLFSIEAARLQLCLSLFYHKSISCDRNCEGDESESDDSEEDWLATDTDTEDDSEDEDDNPPDVTNRDDTEEDDNSDSSVSNFSQRSWYGSASQLTTGGRQLTPLSTPPALSDSDNDSSDSDSFHQRQQIRGSSSWLEDRDDLMRPDLAAANERRQQIRGSSSWLEDRDDLIRVRQFLDSSPGPDFTHSTDSEDEAVL